MSNVKEKNEKEKLKAEIERLKKELKKRKKYGLVWEEKPEEVVEMCKEKLPVLKEVKNKEIITDKDKPVNLLIEGDNYHALSVLNYTHAKKVDVIYIDPPYNTGSRSWKYNNNYVEKDDAYRHSKWASFMQKRLKLARDLLKKDGIIVCTIDDNELYPLGLLMERVFQENNRIGVIVVESNPRGRTTHTFFATSHEYYLIYARNADAVKIENIPLTEEQKNLFNLEDQISRYRLLPLRRSGGLSTPEERPNSFYPIHFDEEHNIISVEKVQKSVEIFPIDSNGRKRVWRITPPSLQEAIDRGDIVIRKGRNGNYVVYMKDRIKGGRKPKTIWISPKYDASTHGTVLLQSIFGKRGIFEYPKSLHAVVDTLRLFTRNNKRALILDFFAGSGTTGQAVLGLNKEDSGNRQFILCTNNENNICTGVCYPRIKKVIEGYKNLKGEKVEGLGGNLKYFKTDFVDYDEPTDKNKIKLTQQATEMLCVKEGTFEKVLDQKNFKIFKNTNHYTGVIFDQAAIPTFKKAIKDIKGKISVYVFSLGDETFDDEFKDVKQKVQLSPIPEAILRVYRRIFK